MLKLGQSSPQTILLLVIIRILFFYFVYRVCRKIPERQLLRPVLMDPLSPLFTSLSRTVPSRSPSVPFWLSFLHYHHHNNHQHHRHVRSPLMLARRTKPCWLRRRCRPSLGGVRSVLPRIRGAFPEVSATIETTFRSSAHS